MPPANITAVPIAHPQWPRVHRLCVDAMSITLGPSSARGTGMPGTAGRIPRAVRSRRGAQLSHRTLAQPCMALTATIQSMPYRSVTIPNLPPQGGVSNGIDDAPPSASLSQ